MEHIQIKPLTPRRAEDFFTFFEQVAFADHPEWGCDCFCCFFHAISREAWETATREANRLAARRMIEQGQMRGLLAYAGETPVGWCHFDRLANLPGAPVFYPELASKDGESAAIVCFTVAQGWRGQGIAAALLKKALEDLKASGVKRVEAYPVLNDDSQEHNYLGPMRLYESAGFVQVKQTEHHALVEKTL